MIADGRAPAFAPAGEIPVRAPDNFYGRVEKPPAIGPEYDMIVFRV